MESAGWLLAGLLWAFLCLLPDGVLILQRQVPLEGDSFTGSLPLKVLATEQWSQGRIPLWTSKLGCGQPLLADTLSLPLDPRNVWFLVLPPVAAFWAMLLTSRLIGGWICLGYFRVRHQLPYHLALLATVVYFFSTIFLHLCRIHSLCVIVDFFPTVIWLTERLLERISLWRTLALALTWALLFFMGSIGMLVYLPPLAFVWALAVWWWQQPRPPLRRFLRFTPVYAGSLLWGVGLCAITFFPFVEFVRLSGRGGEYPEDPFGLRSVFFALVGAHQPHNDFVLEYGYFFYVGVISLPVALGCWWRRDHVYMRMAPWLAVATLLGVLVLTSPLKPLLVKALPVLAVGCFYRLTFFWGLLAAVLVSHGLRSGDRLCNPLARWSGQVLYALQFAPVFLVLLWLVMTKYEAPNVFQIMKRPVLAVATVSFFSLWSIRLLGLRVISREMFSRSARPAVLGLLIVSELVLTWIFLRPREDAAMAHFPVTPEVAYLKQRSTPDYRAAQILMPRDDNSRRHEGLLSLYLDAAAVHGLQMSNHYDSLIVRASMDFMDHYGDLDVRRQSFPLAPRLVLMTSVYDSPLFDAQAVRFLITREYLPRRPDRLLQVDGTSYLVYERLGPVPPRAFFVSRARYGTASEVAQWLAVAAKPCSDNPPAPDLRHDVFLEGEASAAPAGSAGGSAEFVAGRILKDRDRTVEVRVSCPSAGYLVLSDTFYSGWKAWVDGIRVPILRANGFARAVGVGPGEHTVVFSYQPVSFILGALVTMFTGIGTLVVAFRKWREAASTRFQQRSTLKAA